MDRTTLNQTLSTIHTFEDYESQKQHVEEDLARASGIPSFLIIKNEGIPESFILT